VYLLRGYCSKHLKLWDENLHYIQHAYNRAKHSSTQTFPFEACFGYLPKSPLDFIFGKDIAIDGQYDNDRVENFIEQIQSIHQMVQEQLEKSQAKYMTSIVLITLSKLEMNFGFTLVRRGVNEKVKK
jgi:hypothetical protein